MNTWRTYLFVPAKKLSVMKKAVDSAADSVIFDLEDAVANSEKSTARNLLKDALTSFKGSKPLYVRINDVSSDFWEEDLHAAVNFGAAGVVVPKAENGKQIRMIGDRVRNSLGNTSFQLIPLVETARGVQFAYEVASADPLVTNLAFGYIDFMLDIGCEVSKSQEELLFARSTLVIASRAAGIGKPIDSVYPELNNDEGLREETERIKRLGFKGKLIIHPKQIETVHQTFAPTKKELQDARMIVERFEEAERHGSASISVNNRLVDYPVYKQAKEMLAYYGDEQT